MCFSISNKFFAILIETKLDFEINIQGEISLKGNFFFLIHEHDKSFYLFFFFISLGDILQLSLYQNDLFLKKVLDLRKNCQDSTESSNIPCTQFLFLLTSHQNRVLLLQLMNQCWHFTVKVILYSDFLGFNLISFCSKILSRISHDISSSCLLRYILAVTISHAFLILMTLIVLRHTGQVFWKVFLHWDLSEWSPCDQLKVQEEEGHRGKLPFLSLPIKDTCYQHDL